MRTISFVRLTPLLLALVIAAGCGKKEESKSATQVAARVNADEITIHQVNNVLSRARDLTPEAAIRAKSDILEKLIDQQLAKQQAIATEVDRLPQIVQAIEAARSEILARAYLEKVAATLPKPTADEVKKYYADHPELFSQRRIYKLEELAVAQKAGSDTGLAEQVKKASSMKDIAEWLKAQDIKFSANQAVRAAEALPLGLLSQLQTLKNDEIRLVQTDDTNMGVIHLVASETVPVGLTEATPRIQQFLFNQSASKRIAAEMKALRVKADIAYLGEFAGGAAAAEAKFKAEAEASTKEAAKEKAEAAAQAKRKEETTAKADAEAKERAIALAKARQEAEQRASEARTSKTSKPGQVPNDSIDSIEKGLRGLK